MTAYHTTAHIGSNGRLVVAPVPFQHGADVEVIIIERAAPGAGIKTCSLRGKPVRYECPADPVAEDDWKALR